MHTLGKVMAFLVVVAAIAASMITSKLIMVRNSWTAKDVVARKKFQELKPKVDELEDRVDQLKAEAQRKQELWGRYWNGVQTNVANPADGSLQVNIGVESGLSQNLMLYGFELAPDGSSIYRGSFVAVDVRNGGAVLKPNCKVSSEEVRSWQPGTWRWRNAIPPGVTENLDRQLLTILKSEETLSDRRNSLSTEESLLEQANEGLKRREDELIGGPSLEKSELIAPEYREGLVAALEQTEERRNQTLEKIDQLRHQLREVFRQIEQIRQENNELIQKLPQPTSIGEKPLTSRKENALTRKK